MSTSPLLAGVIGWPIAHSRSPRLHGHWLGRYGVPGYYVPLSVAPEFLYETLALLPRLGFRGVNVTIPHKEAVLALAGEATERATRIGAANTLTFLPHGGFRADNTDGTGFINNLKDCAPGWAAASGTALVLGAGGAARAIVDALLHEGAPMVRIANRTRHRAEALAAAFGPNTCSVDWASAEEAMRGCGTIVNTTSLGMEGQPPLELRFSLAEQEALVTDIVYQPLMTPFLARARRAGLRTVDGLGMLLHQAAPGFESWFGIRPEVDADLREVVLGERA